MTPIYLDYEKQFGLENHIQLFFTGVTRLASSVLKEQQENTPGKMKDQLKKMADSVFDFQRSLLKGDFRLLARCYTKDGP